LPDTYLISLTATPPYDVTGPEWAKYQELCGPIDEEISALELVKAGTLCPHQDYVWLVKPSMVERDAVHTYESAVKALCEDLLADQAFRAAVRAHPWLASPETHAEQLLEAPQQAVAMLVFLAAVNEPLPSGLLNMLDALPGDLPQLDRSWWQVLVQSYVFEPHWPPTEEREAHREALVRRLRRDSLLWRRELRLDGSRGVQAHLSLSPSKIGACVDIHRLEAGFRGDTLRQVILTDYIRDDDVEEPGTTRWLGAWPVFRDLVGQASTSERPRLALLTGRLAVVHDEAVTELRSRVHDVDLEVVGLASLPGYSRVALDGGHLVRAFTALLADGVVRTLVGTRALLGEGWDCPCINSLVLCSFVGSFMLTNQMRGRAIRVDAARPDKTASVWHLVALAPGSWTGLGDALDLQRRFSTFVGVGATRQVIESGLDRLDLPFVEGGLLRPDVVDADAVNADMAERLRASPGLAVRWRDALVSGHAARLVPDVVTPRPPRASPFLLTNTFRRLFLTVMWTILTTAGWVLQGVPALRGTGPRVLFVVLALAFGLGLVLSLPKLYRAVAILVRHLPVDGAVRQMAVALRDALLATRVIEPAGRRLEVHTEELEDGGISVWLDGAEFREQALFADSVAELLGPIQNPRYLITRRSGGRWLVRTDYHSVPQALGVKKERAELFHEQWRKHVGPGELVYTRTPETRKLLLRARVRAFSAAMGEKAT
ncbi:MAG: type III restriction endonuclease subunit R, partial [Thermoleophilia bacterium]|nr:type III restriction endonuclease subunit R [Thermoleophilia bacterium]